MKLIILIYLLKPPYLSTGLLSIGTLLSKKGYKVLYMNGEVNYIISKLKKQSEAPLLIGISATTDVFSKAVHLCKEVKQIFPSVKMVLGGNHATALPNESLGSSDFDIVCQGEGERTMIEVVQQLEKNIFPTYVSGTYEKSDKGSIICNGRRDLIPSLKELPIYDLSLLPNNIEQYFTVCIRQNKLSVNRRRGIHLIYSRGCPFDCVFCNSSKMWFRKLRFYPVNDILDHIETLVHTYKLNSFSFLDDDLMANTKFFNELCQGMIKRGISHKIRWECQARAKAVKEEKIVIAKKAGCVLIRFGLESGSNNSLKFLKAGTTLVKDNYSAIKLCKTHGMKCFGSFIVGSPYETLDDIMATIKFITDSGLDSCSVFIATPYPGTELNEVCKKENLFRNGITWDDYTVESTTCEDGYSYPIISSKYFTSEQLYQICRYINDHIVWPVNNGLHFIQNTDHRANLKKIILGDYSTTEMPEKYKKIVQRRFFFSNLHWYIKRAFEDPSKIFPWILRKIYSAT